MPRARGRVRVANYSLSTRARDCCETSTEPLLTLAPALYTPGPGLLLSLPLFLSHPWTMIIIITIPFTPRPVSSSHLVSSPPPRKSRSFHLRSPPPHHHHARSLHLSISPFLHRSPLKRPYPNTRGRRCCG
ncbi:hypothetical protein EX30DRAFT_172109 [Ascodesmis nigricans]|uniref:Uncharacterized protein n=1 Tax=Ascodesmis nigricans TaxID=341454 RepID=A0A4S2MLW2_9PEZI|nr:hypothetical protein EX30DRAFT_172109 [Ascodesmis nigricans]